MNKFIKITTVFFSFIALLGCHGELEPLSYSEINPSIFPQTEADMDALVISCYGSLRGQYDNGIFTTTERGCMMMNDIFTGLITRASDFGYRISILEHTVSQAYLNRFWTQYVNKISRATLVKDVIENTTVLSEERKNKYIAEIACARAFLAYLLFDMYGPIVVAPLEILKNPLDDHPLPRLSNDEMVKFIEDDLLFAAENLPHPRDAEYGRFSSGLAKMLLIRLYLHQTNRWDVSDRAGGKYIENLSNYNKVETLAREIMAMGYYELMPDYPSMFTKATNNRSNTETIFVVPCSYDGQSVNQWQLCNLPGNINFVCPGWGMMQSTWWFYDTFDAGDTRKTFLIYEYETNIIDEETGNNIWRTRDEPGTNIHFGPIPKKYDWDPEALRYGSISDIDLIIFRYADVLLSLAEAIVMKPGGSVTAEAIQLVNTVRARAKCDPLWTSGTPGKEEFIDQLILERGKEFWNESGQYRADLIRHDKALERVFMLYPGRDPAVSTRDKFMYPIPPSIVTNSKGLIFQNPGWEL